MIREIDEVVEFNYAPGWALVHFVDEGPFNTPVRKRDLCVPSSRRKLDRKKEETKVVHNHYYIYL